MKQPPELPSTGKMRKRIILWGIVVLIVGGILGLTHDIIITNYLAHQLCMSDPNPKTFIKKTVDFPESVYWEDNVYNGYSELERLLMIQSYLDGIHLKTMALNGPDGKVYLYTATEDDWPTIYKRKIKPEHQRYSYNERLYYEAKDISYRVKILNRTELPQLNYSVVVNPVPLTQLEKKYLFSDEIVITDNKKKEAIAYNRRLMRFYYKYEPSPIGGCRDMAKLYEKSYYGLPDLYKIDDQSILSYQKPDDDIREYECKKTYQYSI